MMVNDGDNLWLLLFDKYLMRKKWPGHISRREMVCCCLKIKTEFAMPEKSERVHKTIQPQNIF